MEATLSFTGENSNTEAPAWRLTPWAAPEKERVQPLSRCLVPEPVLCVEVSPTISSWCRSTSRTSSVSFPASEVTFHIPRTSRRCWVSTRPGPRLCLPPGSQCTRPLWLSLQVVSPQAPRCLFGLGLAGPRGSRPGHQTLANELPSQVWLQKGAPDSLVWARWHSS